MKLFLQIFLAAVLLAGVAGCGLKSKDEESHPLFKRAVKAQEAGETKLAIEYFQRYLVVNPESSKTYLKLASIYDETLDKPLQAVYHYQRFLEFAPKSPEAENVKKWLEAAKKKFYYRARLEYNDPEDVAALQNTLYTTSQELKKHKLELSKAKSLQKKLVIYARQEYNNEKKLSAELAELQTVHQKTLSELTELKTKIAEQEKKAREEKEKAEAAKKKEDSKAEKTEETATGEVKKTEEPTKAEAEKESAPEEKNSEKTEKPKTNEAAEKPEAKAPEKVAEPVKEPEKTEEKKEKPEEKSSPSPPLIPKAQPAAPPFTLKKVEKPKTEVPSKERTYVVQRGDSLSSISRQFYGSARYYKIIFDANREILPTERALRPGQILKIPTR